MNSYFDMCLIRQRVMNKRNNISLIKKLRLIIRLVPVMAFCMIWLSGCWPAADTGGDQLPPRQTVILGVRVQPDTVAPGDTAFFTCVIEDSLDKRFKFYWTINAGKVIGVKYSDTYEFSGYASDSNTVQWIAPATKEHFLFYVGADDGAVDSSRVESVAFGITVN